MRTVLRVALAALFAVAFTGLCPAQTAVGYGALTGTSATAPAAAGKAAAGSLTRVGAKVARSGAPVPPAGATAAVARNAAGSAEQPQAAASIVLRVQWGEADAGSTSAPNSATPNSAIRVGAAPAPAQTSSLTPPAPRPSSLRRGANIAEAVSEMGQPTLIVQNVTGVGYDRKYVFEAGAGTRYSVMVLGALIVDWERQQ